MQRLVLFENDTGRSNRNRVKLLVTRKSLFGDGGIGRKWIADMEKRQEMTFERED